MTAGLLAARALTDEASLPRIDKWSLFNDLRTARMRFGVSDRDLAVAMCGGDYARDLAGLGQAGAVAHVTELLASVIGPEVRASIKGSAFPCWWADPFSQGSYSVAKPGKLAARDNLALPIGDRIWIAGEATAGGGAMTVGGASLAGIAAARGVVARLKA